MEHAAHSWSTKELMEDLNISRSTVQRLIARGVPHTKVGTRNQFTMEQMEDWLDTNDEAPWNPREWPTRVILSRDTRKVRSMYKQFNAEFFGNKLPHYDVKVVKFMPNNRQCVGLCDAENRTILICWDVVVDDPDYRHVLLHEMCHVDTPGIHGAPFLAKLRRLQRMGETWVRCDLSYYKIITIGRGIRKLRNQIKAAKAEQ